jgi:hypothetical protein
MNTFNQPEPQAPGEGNAQAVMVMGPAIEALQAVEPAAVPALKLAAIEAIVRLPRAS